MAMVRLSTRDGDGAALTTPVRRAEDGNGDFTVETSRKDLGYDGP
jgi:hypothetical protein